MISNSARLTPGLRIVNVAFVMCSPDAASARIAASPPTPEVSRSNEATSRNLFDYLAFSSSNAFFSR
jgi:hypothetical protein